MMFKLDITNTQVASGLRHGMAVSSRYWQLAKVLEVHPPISIYTHDCACAREAINIKAKTNMENVSQKLAGNVPMK